MEDKFAKLKRLKSEYLCLLEISPQEEERIKFFTNGTPLEKLEEHIILFENEIMKLKEELSSSGVDVKSLLENK